MKKRASPGSIQAPPEAALAGNQREAQCPAETAARRRGGRDTAIVIRSARPGAFSENAPFPHYLK